MYQFYPVELSYLRNLYFFDARCQSLGYKYTLLAPIEFGTPPGLSAMGGEYLFENRGGDFHAIQDFVVDTSPKGPLSVVNSSMLGPLPKKSGCAEWPDAQHNLLTGTTQLVGDTINPLGPASPHGVHFMLRHGLRQDLSHVQTGAFTIGEALLKDLTELGFFGKRRLSGKTKQIRDFEILLSDLAKRLGYEIASVSKVEYEIDVDPYDLPFPETTVWLQFLKTSRLQNNLRFSNGNIARILREADNEAIRYWATFTGQN